MRKWKATFDAARVETGQTHGGAEGLRPGASESPVLQALEEGKAGHGEESSA